MLEILKQNIGHKLILIYQEGTENETHSVGGIIRDANENFVLVETDNKRKVWIKPETIIKVKEVQEMV